MVTEETKVGTPAQDCRQIWAWLEQVPDPELPAISVVDLGIVRDVAWEQEGGATCVITITPTYSGCPAMEAIASAIREVLQARGVARIRLETRLSPAWTTDWMSAAGRDKLRAYGVAPPAWQAIDTSAIKLHWRPRRQSVDCPRCGSANTECVSEFGSTACKALYRCKDCLEPFDYFKPH